MVCTQKPPYFISLLSSWLACTCSKRYKGQTMQLQLNAYVLSDNHHGNKLPQANKITRPQNKPFASNDSVTHKTICRLTSYFKVF